MQLFTSQISIQNRQKHLVLQAGSLLIRNEDISPQDTISLCQSVCLVILSFIDHQWSCTGSAKNMHLKPILNITLILGASRRRRVVVVTFKSSFRYEKTDTLLQESWQLFFCLSVQHSFYNNTHFKFMVGTFILGEYHGMSRNVTIVGM